MHAHQFRVQGFWSRTSGKAQHHLLVIRLSFTDEVSDCFSGIQRALVQVFKYFYRYFFKTISKVKCFNWFWHRKNLAIKIKISAEASGRFGRPDASHQGDEIMFPSGA